MTELEHAIRLVRELLDLAAELERRAAEHAADYPGAYADGLEAAAELIRGRARELLP